MTKIDPKKEYSIEEILEQGLIPGINSYLTLYNRLTVKTPTGTGTLKHKREPAKGTTVTNSKSDDNFKPLNKINSKILVKGSEIIKFLKIHNLR